MARVHLLFAYFVTSLLAFANHDLVVYGGTSAGVAAAVQMAREGKTAIVIEPSQHVGGLSSGGLGATDSGKREVIGGLAREFYQRLHRHYQKADSWKQEKAGDYKFFDPGSDSIWRFEPSVAEEIFRKMLKEEGVKVVYGERLKRPGGVKKKGNRVVEITMESGKKFTGKMFLDATYEGDLMAGAGVSFHVGRESNAEYGEALNGVQTRRAVSHQFMDGVDPYLVPGDSKSGLLPGIQEEGPGEEGSGDHRIQAYCFRVCLTNDPKNRVPFPKPEGYDPMRYELLLRYVNAGWRTIWGNHKMMPNRKTDTNNHGGFSTDNIGMNYEYPEGSYEKRAEIIKEHEVYQKGFFWFLCNDPRVPESLQNDINKWGLAADEFTDNGNWPHQLYIREARRMVGEYVQTEMDCRKLRQTPESVGMGSYNMDSHNVQRYVNENGHVKNEGDIQVSPGGPYQISYQALCPKVAECENLLVPVCLSSSHIAYGSIRMEPVFMILGQSSAAAASMAIDRNLSVQDVPYKDLSVKLEQLGQVLDYERPPAPIPVDPAKLPGIVIDDSEAKLLGFDVFSSSSTPYVGEGYRHDDKRADQLQEARFQPDLPQGGQYEIRLSYPQNQNRASNVRVEIRQGKELLKSLKVDQTKRGAIKGLWTSLGKFDLKKGKGAEVVISNKGANGFVIIDSVQFLPIEK